MSNMPTFHYDGTVKTERDTQAAQDAAKGCSDCAFGLVDPPPSAPHLNLFIARRAQHERGELQFCTCKAGGLYERYLRGAKWQADNPSTKETGGGERDGPVQVQAEQSRPHRILDSITGSQRDTK